MVRRAVTGLPRIAVCPPHLPAVVPGRARDTVARAGSRRGDYRAACTRATAALATMICVLAGPSPAAGATRYDPALRFRSITTPHFVIHFHQGEEAEALRLSLVAESVHADLVRRLRHAPRGRTHVVLVDQSDEPNGWATPVPYNLMEITAVPPSGASTIGNTRDWLRLVFTHEYTHVLHLDQSRGWARVARGIFGRAPFAFPNLTLPLWQIEGLATFQESRGGEGRVPAGDFHAIVRQAARAGSFEPLDRVSGGLVDWPAGNGWYAYGAYFHEYLARRFGEEALAELSRRTAGQLPYFGALAFRSVFGASLGTLWKDFARTEARQVIASGRPTPITRVTHDGYLVDGPRFDRDGTIVYTRRDPHEFPTLNRVPATGGTPRRLATRYGGEQTATGDDAIYFDQQEVRANVALSADVYRLDRRTGEVRRLTRGARLTDVDLSPDGTRLAAVRIDGGSRRLVVLDRARLDAGVEGVPADANGVDAAHVIFANPRWSPDGRRIAAERRVQGGPSQIVLVDPDTGVVTLAAESASGRNVTPSWMPDGRGLVFASDRAGGPFDLYLLRLDTPQSEPGPIARLTAEPGGARSPDVSPDGRTVAFVGYTTEGHDVFTMPLTDGDTVDGCAPAQPTAHRADATDRTDGASPAPGATSVPAPYRPWSTVLPRAWTPVLETSDYQLRAGAAVGSADALGYHAWLATATWSVARDEAVEVVSPGARPDLRLAYAYDRWRPTVIAQYTDETTPLLVGEGRRPVAIRARSIDTGLSVPFRRVRWSQSALALWRREHDVVSGPSDDGSFDRGALRFGWAVNTARRYGYSVSPEDGVTAGASVEVARQALGGDGDAQLFRLDTRAFLPLGPRHAVLALRAAAAASRGDAIVRRRLLLGGHAGDGGVVSFDEDGTSLLRGFPADSFVGLNVALVNAEYRVPLAWLERGAGTWPLFLRSLHVSGVFDVGQAWTGRFRSGDLKQSWGIEAGADIVAGYALPFTWIAGVAWGRDGSGLVPDNREVYFRIGRGF